MFHAMRAGGHESVHFHQNPALGFRAIIAIHSTKLGPALGGCRFISYPDEAAALQDALKLARGMTYKAALANVPQGGGKAVILKPDGAFHREAIFAEFGDFVESLGGRYVTAIDSGSSTEDLAIVAQRTAYVTSSAAELDPSPWTALGVFRGIEAAVAIHLGCTDLDGLTVAVQGLGHVGFPLARRLSAAGVRLLVADVNESCVERAVDEFQAVPVGVDQILQQDCDVLVPCGLGGILNRQTISQLQCRIVAGSANNQLASPDCAQKLHDAGILYAPDYVINAGGLIFASLHHRGCERIEIADKTNRIGETLRQIFQRAQLARISPHELAEQMAEEVLQGDAAAPLAMGA